MSVTAAAPLMPDAQAIRADLSLMTARWGELREPAMFELRALAEGKQEQWAQFTVSRMDQAVGWAEKVNADGYNVYAVRNPIRLDHHGAANDGAILAAFYCWADCDDADATSNVKRFSGPKWTVNVVTGKAPDTRVHVYWELEEPVVNLTAWREMQVAIAAHFQSDPVVINPSRIMRVAGTVSYPNTKKQARGYTPELVTLKTEYEDEREPVPFERLMRVFAPAAKPASGAGGDWDFDAGPTPMDREAAAMRALSGEMWHAEVNRLVGSYVAKGLTDAEIHAITDRFTLPGWTPEQTRKEVQDSINGARRKGFAPGPEFAPNFDFDGAAEEEDEQPKAEAGAEPPPDFDGPPKPKGWLVQTAGEFVADFVSPEYVIDGIVQRGKFYLMTAPTGHGKTAAMLYTSTAIGSPDLPFCGLDLERGDVLFLAGENPDDVRARMIATMEFFNIEPAACRVHFIAGTFSIRKDLARLRAAAEKLPNLVLAVVDTFAAYFDGDDENSNAQALDFARVVRRLTELPSKPAVIMPAHPVKNAGKNDLTPKGGSSLLNEVDGNLTLWNKEGICTLSTQGKLRGPEFEPLKLELQPYESTKLHDKHGRLMPTILAKPLLQMREEQLVRDALSREDQLLLNIAAHPEHAQSARCDHTGIPSKGALARILARLEREKLIKKFRTNWELTAEGRKAVEIINNGGSFAADAT